MDLNFEIFMVVLLVLSIIVVGNFLRDGASNYLEGAMLIVSLPRPVPVFALIGPLITLCSSELDCLRHCCSSRTVLSQSGCCHFQWYLMAQRCVTARATLALDDNLDRFAGESSSQRIRHDIDPTMIARIHSSPYCYAITTIQCPCTCIIFSIEIQSQLQNTLCF